MSLKNRKWGRAALGGIVGGVISELIASVLFFELLDDIIYNPKFQSPKLIAVWQELEPLPLATTNPIIFLISLLPIVAIHGLVFAYIFESLPPSTLRRGSTYGFLLWLLMAVFFEFFTPFNLLGEPIWIVSLELSAWFIVTQVEGIIISIVYGDSNSN